MNKDKYLGDIKNRITVVPIDKFHREVPIIHYKATKYTNTGDELLDPVIMLCVEGSNYISDWIDLAHIIDISENDRQKLIDKIDDKFIPRKVT